MTSLSQITRRMLHLFTDDLRAGGCHVSPVALPVPRRRHVDMKFDPEWVSQTDFEDVAERILRPMANRLAQSIAVAKPDFISFGEIDPGDIPDAIESARYSCDGVSLIGAVVRDLAIGKVLRFDIEFGLAA